MRKKATIQDIADALGISRNTVSKAINNQEGLADSTREKILQKAVEMGYKQFSYLSAFSGNAPFRPSEGGGPAIPSYKGEISLLSTMFLTPSHFASVMIDKFQREIAQLGYSLNVHRVTKDDLARGSLPVTFLPDRCRGIICFEIFQQSYAELLCLLDIPILFVDGPARLDGSSFPADQLLMDNSSGVTRFVRSMLKEGHKKVGWIGDYEHCQSFYERYLAFRAAMMMAGLPVDESWIIRQHAPKELTGILASLKEYPEAFVCANDFVGIDALRILKELGRKVPEEIRICGFDDSPDSRHCEPKLTTVHIHTQVMALSAVYLLLSRINEPSLDFRVIYTEADLLLRESSGTKGEQDS